jgi:hypothetical protein
MSSEQQTSNMLNRIQAELVSASYTQAELLGWFKAIGNIRNIGKGMLKSQITKIEKMEPGKVWSDLSALPNNVARFTEQTTSLLSLGVKVSIPLDVADRYANNSFISVDMDDIIQTQLKAFVEQIDQFLAYGDSYKTPHTGDKNAGEGVANGLFNGGTTFAAGDGKDNNMTAAGDYQSTTANAKIALENAGFKNPDGYYMFSDNTTYHTAELGVHQLNTYTFTNERRAIDADKDIRKWIFSAHFTNPSAEKRIVITNPVINVDPKDPSKKTFAYRLITGYDLDIYPLYNGGLGPNGRYTWIILWSGALEILRAGAIQASGALTL